MLMLLLRYSDELIQKQGKTLNMEYLFSYLYQSFLKTGLDMIYRAETYAGKKVQLNIS